MIVLNVGRGAGRWILSVAVFETMDAAQAFAAACVAPHALHMVCDLRERAWRACSVVPTVPDEPLN